MESYRSLIVWQRAHDLFVKTLRATEKGNRPPTWPVFDQLRRAAISVEANIVEGYALRAPRQFRRHLRIALGSAAESECLIRGAAELEYLPNQVAEELLRLTSDIIGLLRGLLRRPASTEK